MPHIPSKNSTVHLNHYTLPDYFMTGGAATGRFHGSQESSLALKTQGPHAARLDSELPSTHIHMGLPAQASPHPLLLCSGFQEIDPWRAMFPRVFLPLPLCIGQCLWHLLCGSNSHQTVPQWFSTRWPSASCTLVKEHFFPVEFQFRSISGFLLLLFFELSRHPLFGFSALPSPV